MSTRGREVQLAQSRSASKLQCLAQEAVAEHLDQCPADDQILLDLPGSTQGTTLA